jgi:hypothetical protein
MFGCGSSCHGKQTQKQTSAHHAHNLGSSQTLPNEVGEINNKTQTHFQQRCHKRMLVISNKKLHTQTYTLSLWTTWRPSIAVRKRKPHGLSRLRLIAVTRAHSATQCEWMSAPQAPGPRNVYDGRSHCLLCATRRTFSRTCRFCGSRRPCVANTTRRKTHLSKVISAARWVF